MFTLTSIDDRPETDRARVAAEFSVPFERVGHSKHASAMQGRRPLVKTHWLLSFSLSEEELRTALGLATESTIAAMANALASRGWNLWKVMK